MPNLLSLKTKNQQGFSLIEVMVVVVILGILAAIVVPKIVDRPEQARLVKAKQDILAIQEALNLYKLDNGFYPSTDQGLEALINPPVTPPIPRNYKEDAYLERVPLDPWGRPYQYLNPGQHGQIDIFTYGPTGQPGGKEIGNWNLDKIGKK